MPVTLPAGATVADAVAASGLRRALRRCLRRSRYAIHGQRARPETPLVDGDRIELTRPLVADAKAIRRARAAGSARCPGPRKVKRPPS